jgi:hypothetical protein
LTCRRTINEEALRKGKSEAMQSCMCPPSGGVLRANQMEKVRKSSVVLPHDGGHHDVHLNDV